MKLDASPPYFEVGAITVEEQADFAQTRIVNKSRDDLLIQNNHDQLLLVCKTLESKVLRIPTFFLDYVDYRTEAQLAALIEEARQSIHRKSLITALVPFDNFEVLEVLQRNGALVRGANVAWGFPISILKDFEVNNMFDSELLQNSEMTEFQRCLEASYATYRSHYHTDSRISEYASLLYETQVFEAINRGVEVMVTKNSEQNRILGFSTMDAHEELNAYLGREAVAEIAISGVDARDRQNGIYSNNVRATLSFLKSRAFSHLIFGTAANNFGIQKTWIRLGLFKPLRFTYRLHWWVD